MANQKRITPPSLHVVEPIDGFHAVAGLPVPVSITSLDDAVRFIDEMCSDLFETGRRSTSFYDFLDRGFEEFASTYALSIEDVVSQINALDYKATLWKRAVHYCKRKTIQDKVSALYEALAMIQPLRNGLRRVMDQFHFDEGWIRQSPGKVRKRKERKKEEAITPSVVGGSSSGEGKPNSFIESEYVRYYLANYMVDAVTRELKKKRVFHLQKFPDLVQMVVSQPEQKLRTRWMAGFFATTFLTATTVSFSLYLAHQTKVVEQRKRDIAAFQQTLAQDDLVAQNTQYAQKFNQLLDRAKDFKAHYWLDSNVTANFYVCYKKMYLDQPGVPPLGQLTELYPCLRDLEQRLQATDPTKPVTELVKAYVDNVTGFSTFALEEVDALRRLEQAIEQHYARQLERIKQEEERKGYPLQDVRANVLASKTNFERGRESLHLQFAAQASPLLFYALVLNQLHFEQRYPPGAAGIGSVSTKVARLRTDSDTLGARLMNEYLTPTTATLVRPTPFWQEGGLFEQGAIMTEKLYKELSQL